MRVGAANEEARADNFCINENVVNALNFKLSPGLDQNRDLPRWEIICTGSVQSPDKATDLRKRGSLI